MELTLLNNSKPKSLLFQPPSLQPPPKTSLFSSLFFTWIQPVLSLGSHTKLEAKDAFPLPTSEKTSSDIISNSLKSHSLLTSLLFLNKKRLFLGLFLCTFALILEFSSPIYLNFLITYIEQDEKPLNYGILLASLFTFTTFLYPLVVAQRNYNGDVLAGNVRNMLYNYIYNKSINSSSLPDNVGVNMIQVDVYHVYEFFWHCAFMSTIPFQLAASIYIVYQQVGNAVWIAVAIISSAMLVNYLGRKMCIRIDAQLMSLRDQRVEVSTQMLTEMKMIKVYSWENHFLQKIAKIRSLEIAKLRTSYVIHSINCFYYWALPSLVIAAVFLYYTLAMGEEITTSKIFITLSALSLLQVPISSFPGLCSNLVKMVVSLRRINRLVAAKLYEPIPKSDKISFKNCFFAYEDKNVLKNISLEVNPGEFLAVIGQVGSGKSSLLLSMLGEINLVSGELKVNPSLAYAPSLDSWLLNASLRENILMGREFKDEFYWKVIEACCLMPDINSLPAGDNTEIGERGINLSGGQKARVCLARAVYSEREVYLLDDPLSSVDNHVANHIFNKCFLQLLKGKTRILVTHRLEYLAKVDRVLELRDGKIVKSSLGVIETRPEDLGAGEKKQTDEVKENKLVEDEDREVGKVSTEVYLDYFRYSGGYLLVSLAVLSVFLWMAVKMAADITLKDWSKHPSDVEFYLTLYIALRVGSNIFMLFKAIFLNVIMSPIISKNSHESIINSLSKAPINLFYDITPLGRILNRLTSDMRTIDGSLPFTVGWVIDSICCILSCVVMSLLYFPFLFIIVPFITFPALVIGKYYIRSSRELTRLRSISVSPMINHFTESLSGKKFIRCFTQTDNFILKNQAKVNANMELWYNLIACSQWMRLRLGFLTAIMLSSLFITIVVFRNSVSAAVVGLTLTYMTPLPNAICDIIESFTAIENSMVSVERVKTYTTLPQEREKPACLEKLRPNWPSSPSILFSKAILRYRPNTPQVLKGLSFEIPAGKRVGITGRTGSGKSSLFLSLLRIVELEKGTISIDGVDISKVELKRLRQAITLVPQDPLVFNGTIKENLDPFGQFDESVVQNALNEVQVKFGLDYEIRNSGKSISVGERQLLSLCRALVCNTKIILFDEATAGIDMENDMLIQEVIRKKFARCTILTIAHRLATIIENDLILLMEDGKMKEMGSPKELLAFDSSFKSLVSKMN